MIAAVTIACSMVANDSASADPGDANETATATKRPPNIVFIFSDDHATAAIGAYGSRINQTPNIDRIAAEGVVFRNSFCANSICGPSRACILTGKHSHKNGFMRNGDNFDGSQPTFPKQLQKAGYQTAIVGKWHLKSDPTGFDYWEVLPGQGNYYNPDFLQMDGGRKRYEGYVSDIITERTLTWLDGQRDPDRPFLLMCQHKAPHRNWSPPPRYLTQYDNESIPEPDSLFDDYNNRSLTLQDNEMSLAGHFSWSHDAKFHGENVFPEHFVGRHQNREYQRMNDQQKAAWDAAYEPKNQAFIERLRSGQMTKEDITRWKYQRYIKDYLRCVQAVDDSVGEVLRYLDEKGLAENTIVIYSSDQGFYLGEHGWYDKRWMFEESLKMPLIVRWPGRIDAGLQSDALVQNIDYAPTFMDAAGATSFDGIQGRSMASWWRGACQPPSDWRDEIYYAYYENAASHNVPIHDGVRTDRYKLMFFPRSHHYNLFDLEADPSEMASVADNSDYADVFDEMKQRLAAAREQYDANWAVLPQSRLDEDRWAKRHQELNRRAKTNADAKVVFLGDSITQGWEGRGAAAWKTHFEPLDAINLGIGGDRTEHVLFRLNKGQYGSLRPQVVTLLIGTNNTGHKMQAPGEVAAGIEAIVDRVHEMYPQARVVVQNVFPRGKDESDPMWINNERINDAIASLGDREYVEIVDLSDALLDDGKLSETIFPDRLHLSAEGYERYAAALLPHLRLGSDAEAEKVNASEGPAKRSSDGGSLKKRRRLQPAAS